MYQDPESMVKLNLLSTSLLNFTRRHIAAKAVSLTALLLLSLTALSQSWVNFELQADQYGGETTWEIVQGIVYLHQGDLTGLLSMCNKLYLYPQVSTT